VCTFDFSGCGNSEGKYISLGWHERADLRVVVAHIRQHFRVSLVGLWGRSMGAATSLMFAAEDPSIAGLVLDSPFSSLKTLVGELVKRYAKLPGFVAAVARKIVRKTILSKNNVDIDLLNPIDFVSYAPALFVVAKEDDFVLPSHGRELFHAYQGDKNLIEVEGDHNSNRPQFMLDSAAIFFYNCLQCASLPKLNEKHIDTKKELVRFDKIIESIAFNHKKFQILEQLEKQAEDNEFIEAVADSLDSQVEQREKEMAINKFFSQAGFWSQKDREQVDEEIKKMRDVLDEED